MRLHLSSKTVTGLLMSFHMDSPVFIVVVIGAISFFFFFFPSVIWHMVHLNTDYDI